MTPPGPVRPRTPRYSRFLVVGALVGLLLGLAVAVLTEPAPAYSTGSAVGYLGALGAGVGALLAGIVAILLERRG